MAQAVSSWLMWWRGQPWFSSRPAWQERLGFGLVLAAAGATWWLAGRLPPAALGLVGGGLFLALAFFLRRGWVRFFGPVLFYDLIRTTRHSRFVLYRIYAYFLLTLVAIFYAVWYYRMKDGQVLSLREQAEFAAAFFYTFVWVQITAVVLLTPVYLGGAIAAEKVSGTLEYLLATDLANREIVLSKLVSRVANLLLMLLTGLPVLGLIPFLGGVEPEAVLAGFVVTALTLVSLASVSVLNSVYARRPRDAIVLTYLVAAAYLIVSGFSNYLYRTSFPALTVNLGLVQITGNDLLTWLAAGNPVLQLINVALDMAGGVPLANSLLSRLRDYALFHGTVTILCAAWAAARLRAVFLRQTYGQPKTIQSRPWLFRARVGNWPMVWKEVWVETRRRSRWTGRIFTAVLVAGSFLPAVLIHISWAGHPGPYATLMAEWAKTMGALVACVLLLGVAVRAATALTGERERQTLDNLLTTSLSSTAILAAKWLGSVFSVRWGWLWLGLVWSVGIAWGGLHWLSLPFLLLAWTVYASLLATLGLWFSLVCRNSLHATVWTLFGTLAMGIGFLLVPLELLLFSPGVNHPVVEWLTHLGVGLTPPVVLGRLLVFMRDDVQFGSRKESWEVQFALLGLVIWAVAAACLWCLTCYRFRGARGRRALPPPDETPPAEEIHPLREHALSRR